MLKQNAISTLDKKKVAKMKKFTIFVFSLILIFGMGAASDALAFSRVLTGNWFVSANNAFSWDFDLDGLAQDRTTGVNVEMYLEDDSDRRSESYSLYSNGSQIVNNQRASTGFRTWNLFSGYKLNLSMLGTYGDFWLRSIALNWNNDEEKPTGTGTQVPEPRSLLTLGVVLFGLVAISRRRFKQMN